uniref:Uncharacterized protein n=1 Tax=Heterorhabditis bacteriophora TaxID=37862 RepID=A0A1I7XLQ4_HETBA
MSRISSVHSMVDETLNLLSSNYPARSPRNGKNKRPPLLKRQTVDEDALSRTSWNGNNEIKSKERAKPLFIYGFVDSQCGRTSYFSLGIALCGNHSAVAQMYFIRIDYIYRIVIID